MDEDRRRIPRTEVRRDVVGRMPASPFSAMLHNISKTGCMVSAPGFKVLQGATIILSLSRELEVSGQVVWHEKGKFGVKFHKDIDDAALAALGASEPAEEGDLAFKDKFGRRLPELNAWVRVRSP